MLRTLTPLLGLMLAGYGRPASAQAPVPKRPPELWRQSIERPSRGWDFDGSRILGHVGFKVHLWDATTGKVLDNWDTHQERIFAAQFSPDGTHAFSSSWMGPGPMVTYKSKDTRTLIRNLKRGDTPVELDGQVAGEFSPDGKRVVTFSARPGDLWAFDATVWDAATGREIAKITLDKYASPKSDMLHFTTDGRAVAFVKNGGFPPCNDSEVVLYDAKDGREVGRSGRQDDGHRFTSAGALASFGRTTARLTDAASGKELASVKHDLRPGWGAVWTHDGKRVAAVPHGDSEIHILDMASGKITVGAKCGPYPVRSAVVSPDNNWLAVVWGGANRVEPGLGVYDMRTGKEVARITLADSGYLIGFAPDGKTLLVGGSEFVIYESASGKPVRSLKLLDKVDGHD